MVFRINPPILDISGIKIRRNWTPSISLSLLPTNCSHQPKALFRAKVRDNEGKRVDLVVDSRVVWSVWWLGYWPDDRKTGTRLPAQWEVFISVTLHTPVVLKPPSLTSNGYCGLSIWAQRDWGLTLTVHLHLGRSVKNDCKAEGHWLYCREIPFLHLLLLSTMCEQSTVAMYWCKNWAAFLLFLQSWRFYHLPVQCRVTLDIAFRCTKSNVELHSTSLSAVPGPVSNYTRYRFPLYQVQCRIILDIAFRCTRSNVELHLTSLSAVPSPMSNTLDNAFCCTRSNVE